jgi:integration host factor subunit alpha
MLKIKKQNLKKKKISEIIHLKIGLSAKRVNLIVDDFIEILKYLIKKKELNIKNFGTFRLINKKERIGRNPKNKKNYIIKARKSLSFRVSKKFNNKINYL